MAAVPWQLRVFSVSVRKREKWHWIAGALRRHGLPRGRCLDIGCGVGTVSVFLRQCGGSWTFLEPDPAAVSEAEALLGVPVLRSTLEEQQFPSQTFDLVTAFDVLEHTKESEALLREVHRVLKPRGMFLATTPADERTSYFWRTTAERLFGITAETHGHEVAGFSKRGLTDLLRRVGFTLVELTPFSRFFTEGVELAYNGVYHRRNIRRPPASGYNLSLSPASGADVERHPLALAVLKVVSPFLRGVARLDRVLPLGPAYEYGVVAEALPRMHLSS